MKIISDKIDEKGNIEVVCKKSYLFGLYTTKDVFRATIEYPTGYWNWRCVNNVLLEDQDESLELDYQYREFLAKKNKHNRE